MTQEKPTSLELPSIETAKQQAEAALAQKARRVEKYLEQVEPYLSKSEQEEKEQIKQELEKTSPPPATQQKIKQQVQDIRKLSPKEQLERLVEVAFEQGPAAAVSVARKLDNAFLLDALHDTLAKDKLYQKLKQMGKV